MAKLDLVNFNRGNLVREYKDGATTIKIYDGAYADKKEDEIKQIWENVEQLVYNLVLERKIILNENN